MKESECTMKCEKREKIERISKEKERKWMHDEMWKKREKREREKKKRENFKKKKKERERERWLQNAQKIDKRRET